MLFYTRLKPKSEDTGFCQHLYVTNIMIFLDKKGVTFTTSELLQNLTVHQILKRN
jgi:hypothetical protein